MMQRTIEEKAYKIDCKLEESFIPKILAMYLPQYHQVVENDMWWGKGFTDWVAVKKADKLFEGHIQPKVPLGGRYYNLLKKDTLIWQSSLARKYGVDGFCVFHYWFSNNKQILEKPMENLLKWKEIDFPFCFAWPTESWTRTWKKFGNNWTTKFPVKNDYKDDGFLLRQDFGDEKEWEKHFLYLLPFFQDSRYIRINDKPVFFIYNHDVIGIERMLIFWDNLAKKYNLKGLYFITFSRGIRRVDAYVREFSTYFHKIDGIAGLPDLKVYSFEKTWEDFLNSDKVYSKTTIWECNVNCDDTPRRGKQGAILLGNSPILFKEKFSKLLKKSIENKSPLVLVNAWNEWGEGNYLEPDKENGFSNLEAIRDAKNELVNFDFSKSCESKVVKCNFEAEMVKYKNLYLMMKMWTNLEQNGKKLYKYFQKRGYRQVAIYGYGVVGEMLYDELKNTNIEISYIVDINLNIKKDVPCKFVMFESEWPKVEIVVVTPIDKYYDIYQSIRNKGTMKIVSLYEIVENLFNEKIIHPSEMGRMK